MGCHPFKIQSSDGKTLSSGFACTRGRRIKKCSVKGCKLPATQLCDFRVHRNHICDRPLCSDHAIKRSEKIDFCPEHHAESKLVGGTL